MATYNIVGNAIVEIQILGRLHGQRTRNVFHYRYSGTTQLDGPTTLDAMIGEFRDEVLVALLALQSNEYTCEKLSIQVIKPTRYRARFLDIGVAGGVDSGSLPSTVCGVMQRRGILAGRKSQGRIYLPGVPVSSEADSLLAPGVLAAWSTATLVLLEKLEGGLPTEPFVPIISITDPVSAIFDVDSVGLDRVLRQQRRREVGVGE